jgi:predicted Fe-Mo cluster-binding NifX family protein
MKIAVASSGKDEGSDVNENAGRAPYYLVFDGNGKLIDSIRNPFSVGGGGAGWGAAKMLADKKVDVLVAGRVGPNMADALKQRDIKYLETKGKVREGLSKALKG